MEGSPDALAVLVLVNEATLETLDDDVGLTARAASGIVKHRDGNDTILGTADDNTFGTLAELDAVPYVGVVAFAKLLDYALANGGTDGQVDREWSAWPIPPDHPPASNYQVSSGVVTDQVTGLEWQQTAPTAARSWGEADSYCATLSLGGAGWRLPTLIELESIVSYGAFVPAINQTIFPQTPSQRF